MVVQARSPCARLGALLLACACSVWMMLAVRSSYELRERRSISQEQLSTSHYQDSDNSTCVDTADLEAILDERTRLEKWKFVEEMLKNEAKTKKLPSIIGIGVEKCGTHALAQFLWSHPLVRTRDPIEAHFFEGREKDWSTYLDSMPEVEGNAYTMEKTPAYFSFPPLDIPLKMKTRLPDAKVLVVLCDPAKRVISDYTQELIMGSITREQYPTVESYLTAYLGRLAPLRAFASPEALVEQRERVMSHHAKDYPSTIVTTGLYALHLSRWLEHYNRSQLHVIDGDEMLHHPGRVIERVQSFLGLPPLLRERDFVRDNATGFHCFRHPLRGADDGERMSCMKGSKMRTRHGRTRVSEVTMGQLRAFYRLPNELLFRMIGTRFDW